MPIDPHIIAALFLASISITLLLAGCISVTRPQRDGAW